MVWTARNWRATTGHMMYRLYASDGGRHPVAGVWQNPDGTLVGQWIRSDLSASPLMFFMTLDSAMRWTEAAYVRDQRLVPEAPVCCPICDALPVRSVAYDTEHRIIEESVNCPNCQLYQYEWDAGYICINIGWAFKGGWNWVDIPPHSFQSSVVIAAIEETRRLYHDDSEHAAGFIAAMLASPECITTRSVFCDWCQEYNYPLTEGGLRCAGN